MYDLLAIIPFLRQHGTDPMTGKKMAPGDLIKLNYARNNQGVSLFCLFTGERECSCHLELTRRPFTQQYHDPITFKVFNDHTAIAAIKTTGNVYARESIDRLNLKPNNLHDVRFVLFSPVEPSLVMGGAVAARLGSTEPTNSLFFSCPTWHAALDRRAVHAERRHHPARPAQPRQEGRCAPFLLLPSPSLPALTDRIHLFSVSKFDYVRRALKVDDADQGALSGINVEASGIGRVLKTIEKGKQDKLAAAAVEVRGEFCFLL